MHLDEKGKPTFKYTRAAETDVSKTWARFRKEQKEAEAARPKKPESVVSIKRKSA
jgi:hypothetical protein